MKKLALAAAAVLLVVAARSLDLPALSSSALSWIRGLGPWGPLAFIGLYVVACILLLPGAVLTLGAGAVYGLAGGFAAVSAASTLGATAAFLIGRHLARDWVAARLAGQPRLSALDAAVAREGWKFVFLARLSPLFPFNLLNYAFGLTRVPLKHYILASWVGMMPGTLLYVYLGSVAGDLAGAGRGGSRSPAQWAMTALGLAATAAVALYAAKVARRELNRHPR